MTNLVEKKDSDFISSKEDVAIDLEANLQKKVEPLSAQFSKPLSERSRRYSYEKKDMKCKLANQISTKLFGCSFGWLKRQLHRLMKCFLIYGESRVKRQNLKSEDFDLPDGLKLAEYDPRLVASYWKDRNASSIWQLIVQIFCLEVAYKLMPIWFVYMLSFYVFNIYGFNKVLCEDSPTNSTENTTIVNHLDKTVDHEMTPFAFSRGLLCNPAVLEHYRLLEHDLTKVLTFFIGFFVSLSVNFWYSQIRSVPKLDRILVQINNFLWVDPTKLIDDVKIKDGLNAKQFRKTIVRYFLLSWTICLSRMSVRLNENLMDEIALNKKRLMSKREFDILNCGTGRNSWREKWSTPLSWVAMIVNDANTVNNIDSKSSKIIDIKDAIGKTLNAYIHDLEKITSYNEHRIPAPLIQILQVAIMVFFVISIIAGQDMYLQDDEANFFVKLVCDYIPWIPTVKYLMLWGWLKVAADLTVPFGNGRHCLDLLGFLDFEIWKASHMLAHGLPLKPEESSKKEYSKNRVWVEIDHY